jgi:8-oxo-dGTP pyrophosphatase MutT (NUDIX family)
MAEHSERANPWTTTQSEVVYENAWIRVREDQVIRPDGQPGIYGVVHFKSRAVGVLPVEADGSVWLVGQHRYPLDRYSWEIPEGGCPEGEDLEESARRELREETGLTAGRLEQILTTHLSNSVSDEWGVVFRATELLPGPAQPEGTERLDVRRVGFSEALGMVRGGEITDSISVMALLHEAAARAERARPAWARPLILRLLEGELAIAQLPAEAEAPPWVEGLPLAALLRDSEELTVVAPAERFPAEIESQSGWRAYRIEGPFDLDEFGVLASLTSHLAEAEIAIFTVATYSADLLLVRDAHMARATDVLRKAGHQVLLPESS